MKVKQQHVKISTLKMATIKITPILMNEYNRNYWKDKSYVTSLNTILRFLIIEVYIYWVIEYRLYATIKSLIAVPLTLKVL